MARLSKPHDVTDATWLALLDAAQEDAPTHAFLTMLEVTGKSFAQVMTELALHQSMRCRELTKALVDMRANQGMAHILVPR